MSEEIIENAETTEEIVTEETTDTATDSANDEQVADKEGLDTKEESTDPEIYGSPETYDYSEIELPDGMKLDEELVQKFDPLAKKYNLSNNSANELMKLAVELVGKNTPDTATLAQQVKQVEANECQRLLNTDKELNAMSEEQYGEYINLARLGVQSVATDEFKTILKERGLSNHPAFIKTFYQIGKMCQVDKVPHGNRPAGLKESAADILYKKD